MNLKDIFFLIVFISFSPQIYFNVYCFFLIAKNNNLNIKTTIKEE